MLNNKTVLITGATDGIGSATAHLLAQHYTTLILLGKDAAKGKTTKREIADKTGNNAIFYFNADFTSFNEIKTVSEKIHTQFSHIDILINNAGIFEPEKVILPTGIEKNFMVNHLAPFALTHHLLDLLLQSKKARIINVSSMIHAHSIDFDNLNGEKFYSGDNAYSLTKLTNILFTYALSEKLKQDNITVNALHPGVINTKLLRAGWGAMGGEPLEGAQRIFYLANSEEVAEITGKYFMNDKATPSAPISYDKTVQKRLWDISDTYD